MSFSCVYVQVQVILCECCAEFKMWRVLRKRRAANLGHAHAEATAATRNLRLQSHILVFIFVEEINQRKYFSTKLKISLYHFDDTQSLH